MRATTTAVLAIVGWEAFWYARRANRRLAVFAEARAAATALGRPLLVVGAPDRGASGSPVGDIHVDIGPSSAPNFVQADICAPLPFASDSVVVYVSCVLEYVADLPAAIAELNRISGGHVYAVRVEPWTLTAFLYPGARNLLPTEIHP
jgi:SAM-dependent methyltransferase